MPAKILMLCPSRERPGFVAELRREWARVTGTEADLLVVVDEDDPQLAAYQDGGPVKVIEPLGWLGPILNQLAGEYAPQYEIIGFLGDDHRPRTPGWALRLAGAIDGRPGVAYGNDLNQGANAATAVMISSSLITALGCMVPGRIRHLCMDLFWIDLGRETALSYLPDVIIEHLHPTLGTARWDSGYLARNAPSQFVYDWNAYEDYLRDGWPGDLQRLREKLGM